MAYTPRKPGRHVREPETGKLRPATPDEQKKPHGTIVAPPKPAKVDGKPANTQKDS